MMNEGIERGDFFSDGNNIEKGNNGELKPVGRLTGKRKNSSEKLRRKREKRRESSATSTGATAAEDGEDEDSYDLPAGVSSTSGTESITKTKLKEIQFKKRIVKKSPNFAKIVKSLNASPFVFQKRLSRIDWRKLHTIDVNRVIREVDLDTLESVLDAITFADIQGEDTRNFSEANFIKVFRLAQLMVYKTNGTKNYEIPLLSSFILEIGNRQGQGSTIHFSHHSTRRMMGRNLVEYLLYVQELLASHKETLMATGAELQRQVEKHRQKQVKLMSDLSVLRHNLKQAKKTIRTYEIMLRVQNKFQHRQQKLKEQSQAQHDQQAVGAQTVRCCPLCDKLFESAYYLDLHVARRHPKFQENAEDTISSAVSKAEEATAALVRAETTAALQAEIKLLQVMSQAELQRAQAVAQLQVSSLETTLRETNAKLLEVQSQLQAQTIRKDISLPDNEKKDDKLQERLKEMDQKLQSFRDEIKHLNEENSSLRKSVTSAHSEEIHKQIILKGRDRGAEDWPIKPGKGNKDRPASADRKRGKERRKWKHDLSTSPERSESEGRQRMYDETIIRSSASERKRKQSWRHNLPKTFSSPEKTDRHTNGAVAGQGPSSPSRHRNYKAREEARFEDPAEVHVAQQYKQWKASLRPKQDRDVSPEKEKPSPRSGSHTPISETASPKLRAGLRMPHVEVLPDLETGVRTPPLAPHEATFEDVDDKTFVMAAKAEVEKDLLRAGESRSLNEDDGKVASKIAIFETKVATKKNMRDEQEGIRRSDEEVDMNVSLQKVARPRKMKERTHAKEKPSIEDTMEEEIMRTEQARWKAEIADAATMDVGEDHPPIPPSEKEKWLEEHPYKSIPQRPHILSKYPHPPDVFSATRDELAHRLDEQIGGELRKFGFGRNTAAISDSVYDAAKAVLEKQNKARVSNLQLNHRKTLEYEKGAILWQTQRAVRDRDIQIIEAQFEAESERSSQHALSPSPRSPSTNETDDNSTDRTERGDTANMGLKDSGWSSHRITRGVRVLTMVKVGKNPRWFGRSTSPVVISPRSSSSPTVKSPKSPRSPKSPKTPKNSHLKVEEQVKRETHVVQLVRRLKDASGNLDNNRGRDLNRVTYSTVNFRSPPDSNINRFRGNNLKSPPKSPHNTKHSPSYLFPTVAKFKKAEENKKDYEHNNGDTFGLGEWDSDGDVPPATTQRDNGTRKQNEGASGSRKRHPRASKGHPEYDSNNDSEESKIFQELDAEIDEIIKL